MRARMPQPNQIVIAAMYPAALEQSLVMTFEHLRLDLLEKVERHTNDD